MVHDDGLVGHHGHSVEGGLSVEEDVVAVEHVAVDDVAFFEFDGVEVDVGEGDGDVAALAVRYGDIVSAQRLRLFCFACWRGPRPSSWGQVLAVK